MEQVLVNGRYALTSLLGSGGMGKVYLARDGVLGRDVALKLLREQYAEDEAFVERFRREAQNAASLSHPNVVAVYDWGRAENGAYHMAMEYVSGGTLKDRVEAEGPLESREVARLGAQVAEALGAAHGHGLVHRDVKPQNVMLTSPHGDAKVADFGIALAANATTLTRTSHVLGTARYMSPEQALGEGVGPASDLYSLGVVLFEALTGVPLYDADGPITMAMKHVNEPPRPPREANPGVPETMDAIVLKLLTKDPKDRYASAKELAEDLRRARDDLSATAPREGAPVGPVPLPDHENRSEGEQTREQAARVPETPARIGAGPADDRVAAPREVRRRKLPWVLAALLVAVLLLLGAAALDPFGGSGGPTGTLEDATRSLRDVSSGAREAKVPSVLGLPAEEARGRLKEAGLKAALEPRESSEKDAGRVLDQSVPEGERANEGSRVILAVGDGPGSVEAPDLSGMRLDEAKAALEKAGLTLGGVNGAPSEDVPTGHVVGQDPAAGKEAKRDTAVRLTLSSGPEASAGTPGSTAPAAAGAAEGSDAPDPAAEEPVAVPDVSNVGVEEATRTLEAAGCSVVGTTEVPSPEPAGTVLGTDPPVGTAVESGTAVTLVVSAGPPPEVQGVADTAGQYQYPAGAGEPAEPVADPAVPTEPPAAEPAPYEESLPAAEPPATAEPAVEAPYEESPQDEVEDSGQYEDEESED